MTQLNKDDIWTTGLGQLGNRVLDKCSGIESDCSWKVNQSALEIGMENDRSDVWNYFSNFHMQSSHMQLHLSVTGETDHIETVTSFPISKTIRIFKNSGVLHSCSNQHKHICTSLELIKFDPCYWGWNENENRIYIHKDDWNFYHQCYWWWWCIKVLYQCYWFVPKPFCRASEYNSA